MKRWKYFWLSVSAFFFQEEKKIFLETRSILYGILQNRWLIKNFFFFKQEPSQQRYQQQHREQYPDGDIHAYRHQIQSQQNVDYNPYSSLSNHNNNNNARGHGHVKRPSVS